MELGDYVENKLVGFFPMTACRGRIRFQINPSKQLIITNNNFMFLHSFFDSVVLLFIHIVLYYNLQHD